MNKKASLTLFIFVLFAVSLFSTQAQAQTSYFVYGNNFELYFTVGETFGFQHVYDPQRYDSLEVLVNVTVGTVNGTSTRLRMNVDGGNLRFTSQENCTLTAENARVFINEDRSYIGRVVVGDDVNIIWGVSVWSPVALILGLIGLALFIVTPVYTVYEVKQKKNYIWLVYCLALFSLAYAFTASWFQ